jgi:hypothetical protein
LRSRLLSANGRPEPPDLVLGEAPSARIR